MNNYMGNADSGEYYFNHQWDQYQSYGRFDQSDKYSSDSYNSHDQGFSNFNSNQNNGQKSDIAYYDQFSDRVKDCPRGSQNEKRSSRASKQNPQSDSFPHEIRSTLNKQMSKRGFKNPKSLCYLNSLLQCLLNLKPFQNLLKELSSKERPLLQGLYELQNLLVETDEKRSCVEIFNLLASRNDFFVENQQRDVFLCFGELLQELLQEEENITTDISDLSPLIEELQKPFHGYYDPLQEEILLSSAIESWDSDRNKSKIDNLFKIVQMTKTYSYEHNFDKSMEDPYQEIVVEDFPILVLPIEQQQKRSSQVWLDECLHKYFSRQSCLLVDNVKGNEYKRLLQTSDILIIYLDQPVEDSTGLRKDIPVYIEKDNLDLRSYFQKSQNKNTPKETYNLQSIICYQEISKTNKLGHWICFVRSEDDSWFKYNDEEVVEISCSKLYQLGRSEAYPYIPYMLFYQKNTFK